MRRHAIACTLPVLLLAGAGLAFGELRIGLMPACNSIPLIVAEAQGYYQAHGVDVSLVPFNGQLERETALQAGAIDGTISDMINAIQSWEHGFGARVTSATEGNFSLLASPHGALLTLRDWPGNRGPRVRTALLENSIVFYLTERMLTRAGADASRIELVPVIPVPARLELLIADKVDAACLPEPVATLAVSRGARILADSDSLGATPGVLLFTKKALAEKVGQIRAFYRAYDEAVDEVNAKPDAYRAVIVAGCNFPPAVSGLMRVPRFHRAFLPSEELVTDVGTWMKGKGLTAGIPAYTDIVLPGLVSAHARAE